MERAVENLTLNGFPKHGNHPLAKVVQLLGRECTINHLPYGQPVGEKHVFIKRDPRNGLVAWLRMNGQPETAESFIAALHKFQDRPLVEELADYEGWLTDPGTLVVRYEAMIASPAEIKRIAAYLDVDYSPSAFNHLPGLTRTWTGPNHSDYRNLWTPAVETAWADEGGAELLKRWGY